MQLSWGGRGRAGSGELLEGLLRAEAGSLAWASVQTVTSVQAGEQLVPGDCRGLRLWGRPPGESWDPTHFRGGVVRALGVSRVTRMSFIHSFVHSFT